MLGEGRAQAGKQRRLTVTHSKQEGREGISADVTAYGHIRAAAVREQQ